MTDLERRALLGDAEAQLECAEKGIVLGCPCCGVGAQEITYCANTRFICEKCGTTQIGNFSTYDEALSIWNVRPAPPIGRCGECEHKPLCINYDCMKDNTGFCKWFKPKED